MIKYNLNKIEKKVNKHSNKKWNKLKYRLKTFFDIWIRVAWDIRIGFVESIEKKEKYKTRDNPRVIGYSRIISLNNQDGCRKKVNLETFEFAQTYDKLD